jgi:peptide-methionine (S)-S-oxide reductase
VKFWPAEDYHQDYFGKHPDEGYCSVVIRPKIQHLKEMLQDGK